MRPARHYIAYTDIGLARSLDAGKTWNWWGKGRAPWRNTCYELAFDPQTPGRIWGAFSDVHDIPNGNIIHGGHRSDRPGGVCVSTDFGDSWKPLIRGLPRSAAVSIVLDPKSPRDSRTLYVSMFNHGVYKSVDGGKDWMPASQGLGGAGQHARLPAPTAWRRKPFRPGHGYESEGTVPQRGGGPVPFDRRRRHWKQANTGKSFLWPKDFTVDPADSKIVYVGAADAPGRPGRPLADHGRRHNLGTAGEAGP